MSQPEPEPIAIIGLGCRFPGGADTPEKLWDIAYSGRQCWEEVPSSRYNWEAFHHPDPDAKGTHNARGGFFLDQDLAGFDARFFGIHAAEAAAIDPQQRLLLEVSYEALESAGMTVESVRGSQMGVYVALVSRDYDRQTYKDPYQIPKHHLTGCGDATACGRISYVFDLRGPCMSLDTGCSGGMVALHLACQTLRLGEADSAIVGGTNLLLGPDMTIAMSALHMINDNGRCYPFDSRGAGYGRAEGVAALVLKRLKDAVRDGDPIRAVIRNTGINQDGKTNGILLPSSDAQRQLTESLYSQARLNPQDVCYVEAHGTGTQAGDAAEVNSIKNVFASKGTRREHPLFLGSIKANLGHSESTSGLAGVIKTVMALEKAVLPPVAALETLKPDLHPLLESGDIIIPQKPYPWPHQGPRLASVNSFGFGGTNSHVILESAPALYADSKLVNGIREVAENINGDVNGSYKTNGYCDSSSDTSSGARNGVLTPSENSEDETLESSTSLALDEEKPQLFVISAKSKISLEKAIQNVKHWATSHGTTHSKRRELARTLSLRRSRFNWRSSIVASSYQGLLAGFKNPSLTKSSPNSRIVFLFTGQGAQYHGMGRQLLHLHTAFARSLYRSQDLLTEFGAPWRLVDELLCEESKSRINSSELSQPATTAIQIALVDLLEEMGVRPGIVLGHSSGEVAAAYAAGILGHRDALMVSYHKGFVAGWCKETVSSKGAMLAVGLGEVEAMRYVKRGRSGRCVVACVNSPSSVTLSGDEIAVTEIQELLDKDSVFNRRLRVDIAYHSHHMEAVSETFRHSLRHVTANLPRSNVRFFSSVTGAEKNEPLGPSYWVDNLVSQVRFSPALEDLAQMHFASSPDGLELVEIGPHAALQGPIRQIMTSATGQSGKWSYTPSLIRNKDAHEAALELTGTLFEHGVHVNLTADLLNPQDEPNGQVLPIATDLPPYSWDHSNQYWHESRLSKEYRFREHPPHDLLGLRLTGTSTIEPVFRHILSVDDLPWLREHIIDGFALYPGSAFLCMAIEGLKQVSKDRGEKRDITKYIFHDVSFSKALVVPESPDSIEVLISLKPSRESKERLHMIWEEFRVTSIAADGTWNEHCRGSIRAEFHSTPESTSLARNRLEAMRKTCQENINPKDIYGNMRQNGIDYGDSFAIIHDLQLGDRQAIGKVQVPDIRPLMPSGHMQPHVIHPAVFDAFMHIALPLYHKHCSQGPVMLIHIGEVSISADILNKPGDELLLACRLTQGGRKHGSVEVSIFQEDAQGNLIEAGSLVREDFRGIGEGGPPSDGNLESASLGLPPPCYSVGWIPAPWFSQERADSGNLDEHKVHVASVSKTPPIVSLAKALSSQLRSKWEEGLCVTAMSHTQMMGPGDIYIIVTDDALSQSSTVQDIIPVLTHLKSVLWVTVPGNDVPGSPSASPSGLARASQNEMEGIKLVTLDYQQDSLPLQEDQLFDVVREIVCRTFVNTPSGDPIDLAYLYRDGSLFVPRLQLDHPANQWLTASANGTGIEEVRSFHDTDHALKLHFKTPGLLDSAVFVPVDDVPPALEPDEIAVKVYAHAVNPVDVAVAVGRADPTDTMMGEFAGVIVGIGSEAQIKYKLGERVCGWGSLPYTNIARVKSDLTCRIDDSVSFVEGASIPVAFQTAAYALDSIARLEKGQTILIHGAAGAVGQAAVSLAQHIGAEVYATVGTPEKKQLLIDEKGIPENQIFSSTSTVFKDEIHRLTARRGVDVVLNCSSGDLLDESMSCVADFGYLLDVTKSKRPLSLESSRGRNITFAAIDMKLLAAKRPAQLHRTFAQVMSLYQGGMLKPIRPLTTMSLADLPNAFRLVHSQRYSGKIVLTGDTGVLVKQITPKPEPLQLAAEGVYAVVGGSGSLNHNLCMFLEDRGAKNIVSITSPASQKGSEGGDSSRFQRVEVDLCNRTEILSAISSNGMPPTRGILYIEDIPGTSIEQAAKDADVEFCITIRSIDDLLSPKADILTTHKISPGNYMTLRLGAIEDAELNGATQVNGHRTPSMGIRDLYKLIEYCIISGERRDGIQQLFSGLDKAVRPLNNPIFSALADAVDEDSSNKSGSDAKKIDQQIADADNLDEVHRIVTAAAVQQLASFLALDPDDIQVGSAVADVGLDSLLAIEFKNWVVRTLQAPMQTSEILDAPSLAHLVQLIVQRSKLVQREPPEVSNGSPGDSHGEMNGITNGTSTPSDLALPSPTMPGPQPHTLPPLRIPELKALIERHLSYLRAFATDEEFKTTLQLAADFEARGSMGRRLYDRLSAIKDADPEHWYHDLYLRNQYLVRNGPLAPYMNFFFTHPPSPWKHSQAERAALIASAVIDYRHRLLNAQINPRYVNEQLLCMGLYQYLFNASREARVGVDVMAQYPGNDYFVALRRGHVYKVDFDGVNSAQEERLHGIFEAILEAGLNKVDWLGILTADDRISWAKNRQAFMELSDENATYIQTIERSAFVLCLDDASPETPEERGRHFHFGDGSNRWNDKPIEYIIAANGASGIVGDHTGLDAGTVHELNTEIADRIRRHQKADRTSPRQPITINEITHSALPTDIESRIHSVRANYNTAILAREHRYPTPLPYGSALMKQHSIPANSAFQLLVQLAGRYYFGHTGPCWETVLQSNFAQGRVEINQVVSTQVAAFVTAATDNTTPLSTCRQLLIDAARTHSSSVLACTRAGGSDRFLSMLREIVEEGEEEPGLYHDPVYKRARPRKLISNCFATGMAENGCCLRDDEGIWLHFEVELERVKFSILGPTGKTERFCDSLVKASVRIREILEGGRV